MALNPGKRFQETEEKAASISQEMGHFYLGAEHYFLALLEQKEVAEFFTKNQLAPQELTQKLKELAPPRKEPVPWEGMVLTPRIRKLLKIAREQATLQKASEIEPQHFLLALLKEQKSLPARLLKESGADLEDLQREHLNLPLPLPGEFSPQEIEFQKKHPNLARYGRNLVALAREGKIDPVIGRQDEIRRVMQILTRKTKNNPVLIGEAGVGKTAVAYGLALRIAEAQVPSELKAKKIIDLNLPGILAGAKHRGEFEERLQSVIKEVGNSPEVILFIDELHTIVGAGEARGGMDAGNILKPVLARGEFPCIGATTINEYRKYIEADAALERRFQPVLIKEPTEAETLEILKGLKSRFEKHHQVEFQEAALLNAVKLSTRFLPDRFLPDKAIDLIDEAASRVKLAKTSLAATQKTIPQITPEDIAQVVSLWTGIPVLKLTQEETQKLLEMENLLASRVIGQPEAVKAVAQTIRMNRMGLTPPNRPSGVFIFLGPTGVGKTELAKALAEFLFGSENQLIRLDMSEYQEKHSIARLVGSPPGYVGYEEEGQLTKAVRTKPYSVILLDEIEKAHPDVFDLFLQVFDDARLTDGKGRTVNFANAIIILTSNLGSSEVDEQGKTSLLNASAPEIKEKILQVLKKHFRPEFLNRIDETIIFNPLGKEELDLIVRKNLEILKNRLAEKEITLKINTPVIDFIKEKGYEPAYGARPLKRAIQNFLAKPLADAMLSEAFKPGTAIEAQMSEGQVKFFPLKPDLDETKKE